MRKRLISPECFPKDVLSDNGGFTVKHHQQTFVLAKKNKQKKRATIVLSSVTVFISCKQLCEVRSLIAACFPGGREEAPSAAVQQSLASPVSLLRNRRRWRITSSEQSSSQLCKVALIFKDQSLSWQIRRYLFKWSLFRRNECPIWALTVEKCLPGV